MAKLNAYVPLDKYKNYSNPTTKPFRSSSEGYKEKAWTLQEQIQKKLEKADKFIEELFLIEDGSQNKAHINKVKGNFELLCQDLGFMENTLRNEPFEFNTSKLEANTSCILEMKEICETIKKSVIDRVELKKLGKLEHVLTELGHIIEPERGFRGVSQIGFRDVQADKTNNAITKKGSAKMMAQTKVKAKPVKKTATKKKITAATPKHQPALKTAAKPIKAAVKAPVKKSVKAAAPKAIKAVAKTAVKSNKPVVKATKPAVKASKPVVKASKPVVKATSTKKVAVKAVVRKQHSKVKTAAKT